MTERDFEVVVEAHYSSLYWFALSLVREESEARDLTQQTFYIWAAKGGQIKDSAKVRSWLITTLHREFLGRQRRAKRFPHVEFSSVEHDLPDPTPAMVEQMDFEALMKALLQIEEPYRVPLLLFYFEDFSYKQIAEALSMPPGTVMSRLARGKEMLKRLLTEVTAKQDGSAFAAGK